MSDMEIDIAAELIHETPDAYLIEPPDGKRVWLPKSRCQYDGKCVFTMPEWLAEQKDLV